MRRNEQSDKKTARVTVALPDHVEAWANDRARFIGISRSELICNWIIEHLNGQQGVRTSQCGTPELLNRLEAARDAIEEAFTMVRAGGTGERRRIA